MYKCPHCGNPSIPGLVLFSYPFDGSVTCPTCGAKLKLRRTVLSFLLPIYMLSRSMLGLVFDIRFDLGFAREMAVLIALGALQLGLISFKEIQDRPGH